jgi:ABC-type uncharacterized transport system permease subunit
MTEDFAETVAVVLPVISFAMIALLGGLLGSERLWRKPSKSEVIGSILLWVIAVAYFASLICQVLAEIDCLNTLQAKPVPDGTQEPPGAPSAEFAYGVTIVSMIMMLILPGMAVLLRWLFKGLFSHRLPLKS